MLWPISATLPPLIALSSRAQRRTSTHAQPICSAGFEPATHLLDPHVSSLSFPSIPPRPLRSQRLCVILMFLHALHHPPLRPPRLLRTLQTRPILFRSRHLLQQMDSPILPQSPQRRLPRRRRRPLPPHRRLHPHRRKSSASPHHHSRHRRIAPPKRPGLRPSRCHGKRTPTPRRPLHPPRNLRRKSRCHRLLAASRLHNRSHHQALLPGPHRRPRNAQAPPPPNAPVGHDISCPSRSNSIDSPTTSLPTESAE